MKNTLVACFALTSIITFSNAYSMGKNSVSNDQSGSLVKSTSINEREELNQVVFTKYGKIHKSEFANYAIVKNKRQKLADYDVYYYVPKSLEGKKNIKSLFFLHGGGQSTMTRSGSRQVTKMYIEDLKSVADKLQVALICPSGSAQNWGGHLVDMLRDLKHIAIKDLNLDRNSIALSGHSMGGMGITRSAHYLASEFSFFMPVAAGYDFKPENERVNPARRRGNDLKMDTYFNHRYVHLQGKNDHFRDFIKRVKEQERRIKVKEVEFGKKSKFEPIIYNGDHNYPKTQYTKLLAREFENSKRDPYQKELYGLEYNIDELIKNQWTNGFSLYYGMMNSYFWIEGLEHKKYKQLNKVRGKIKENSVALELDSNISKVRVYLDQKMLDLSQEITISVNGENKFSGIVEVSKPNSKDLDYSTYVDIQL